MTLPISVVIPTYNTPTEQLARAINSAMDAGANDIHVVNDGGEPIDYAYPMHLKNGSFVWFYNQPRGGVCAARNFGITSAKSDLIVPLDADDELLPDGLQILYEAWQSNTLVYGSYIERDYEWGAAWVGEHPPIKSEETRLAPPATLLHRKSVSHATWIFHRDDWCKVGGYDPDFNIGAEDQAFMVALITAGVTPTRVTSAIYRKHIYPNSRTDAARSRYPFIQQLLREKYPTFFR